MSLGHMTKQEQVITIGGFGLTMMLAFLSLEFYGETGFGVTLAIGLVLTFAGKLWCWQHTVYDEGLTNPKFVRSESQRKEES